MATPVRDDETVIRPAWTAEPLDTDVVDEPRHVRDERVRGDGRRTGMFTHTIRVALATLVLAAIVLFATANTGDVRPDFLYDRETVPLWTVVAGSAFAGFLLGQLLHRRR